MLKVGSIKNRVPDFQQLKEMEMVKALGATEGDAFPAENSHRIDEYVKIGTPKRGGGGTGAIKAPVNEVPEAKEGTVMLATVHLSSCRQLTWASYQQTKFSFAHHFSSSYYAYVSGNNKKYTAAHHVSHKVVPGGPNPLHN
ncbi:hypothetical protein J1N35_017108 [Gossypium stocksii]|uniref:Uncharacterized protein n=1 Tax=Gossypium stocksii TaxID=47602 RepID=A0A9D3VLH7_9ROSI|nr:hypothetical protein J1N35_017108 [Gossypium stocksii]